MLTPMLVSGKDWPQELVSLQTQFFYFMVPSCPLLSIHLLTLSSPGISSYLWSFLLPLPFLQSSLPPLFTHIYPLSSTISLLSSPLFPSLPLSLPPFLLFLPPSPLLPPGSAAGPVGDLTGTGQAGEIVAKVVEKGAEVVKEVCKENNV